MSADTTTRLEALGNITSETEDANPSQERQQEQEEQATKEQQAEQGAKDWGLMMFTIGGLVCLIDPRLKQVYTEERCLTWGQHANVVASKYGLNGMTFMPELALLGCTIGFALPTVLCLKETVSKLKAAPGQPSSWMTKVGVWWRTRGARKGAAATAENGDAGPQPS